MTGVNIGGWFVLEDWFFSGTSGRHVMSIEKTGQGLCLPPLLNHVDEPWPSEGILTYRLNQSKGEKETVEIFNAHRETFLRTDDLMDIAAQGIQTLRLPLTWAAFADALAPLDAKVYGSHDPDKDTVVVPDPFYHDRAAFVTLPRMAIRAVLQQAAKHGLKVVLDMHALPGGAQEGTYNGVWPNPPMFWREPARVSGDTNGNEVPLTKVGLMLAKALIEWVENLDEPERRVVSGLALMNEPAHMNAYRDFAREADVLQWLSSSVDMFRESSLPQHGKKLYVNIIDTAFKDFAGTVMPWWQKTFSQDERLTWAVAEWHWYAAWAPGTCDGRTVSGGAYSCYDSISEIQPTLHRCAMEAAGNAAGIFGEGLVALSEFSAGTFEDMRYACTDKTLLKLFLDDTVAGFQSFNMETFFWTWKIPYGASFQPGWSLKWLSGLEYASKAQLCGSSEARPQDAEMFKK